MDKLQIWDRTFEVMIPSNEIAEAVERVAQRINNDYCDEDKVVLLGVLNGSFMFLSDLARLLNFRVEVSFIKLSSYDGTTSTGCVKELIGVGDSLRGRNVVIVEDIVDSGNSIAHLTRCLEEAGVASQRVCTLFFKPAAYKETIEISYPAMEIGNDFIVGYGLDYNQLGRELKDIYVTR